MENHLFNGSLDTTDQIPMEIDRISADMYSSSHVHRDSLSFNSQNQIMSRYPLLPSLPFEQINDLRIEEVEPSACGNTSFQDHLANLFATNTNLLGNLNEVQTSTTSGFQIEDSRTFGSNGCCNTSSSNFDKYVVQDFGRGAPMRTIYHPLGTWVSTDKISYNEDRENHFYGGYCMPNNDLSLSLATYQPSAINIATVPDQCSDVSSEAPGQTSRNSKELSSGFGYYKPIHLTNVVSGSKYLHAIQQILAEVANYSVGDLDHLTKMPFSSSSSAEKDLVVTGLDGQMEFMMQRQDGEAKKAQLLTLLQMVDSRYNQCLDEIHTVVSAFHAASDLDPQIHSRFTLQTVSFLFRDLRDRLANQIMILGKNLRAGCVRSEDKSFDSTIIKRQWALQQIKKDHQSWRPQRGLPEKSVSVLRAWMFQNFLHPGFGAIRTALKEKWIWRFGEERDGMCRYALKQSIGREEKDGRMEGNSDYNTRRHLDDGAVNEDAIVWKPDLDGKFTTALTREELIDESCGPLTQDKLVYMYVRSQATSQSADNYGESFVHLFMECVYVNSLYPKDAEKHLLAVRSGLTRNQVANWFINARVRLWKPMIEEMYLEINSRKVLRAENGADSDHGSHYH
ncbi:hypothetical protein GIB67_011007 [Kingdonia uniflora]|uniref:Homeobox domain-containing protein n=1 Tax=Kingdonia uniflora TaxID=39325 RepID=A0A7J7L6D7_9MAGN|nr:hypothetical protein GIB67_011007 [Kingdonia uniflora]